jgi:hypothetical protein
MGYLEYYMTHRLDRPLQDNLPSTKQLLISTLIAFIAACVILITTVLPAEYGIDLTGMGKILGLQRMGEIKEQLKKEQPEQAPDKAQISPATVMTPDQATSTVMTEVMIVTLAPGEAGEVKVAMKKSASTAYSWSIDKGFVNFDNHGDNKEFKYHNYSKGKGVTSDKGTLTAAFNGKHGWFWRNRSQEKVTITLTASGNFSSIHRAL